MLEEGHQRDRRHQDPEEPPVLRAARTDRGLHSAATVRGERGRVQLRARFRMLHAQESHLLGVRDARTESVRFPQVQQLSAATTQIHPSNHAAGSHCAAQTQGKRRSKKNFFLLFNFFEIRKKTADTQNRIFLH